MVVLTIHLCLQMQANRQQNADARAIRVVVTIIISQNKVGHLAMVTRCSILDSHSTDVMDVDENRGRFLRYRTQRKCDELRLLTENHIGTPVGLKRLFTQDFTLTTSTGIVELKFQKRRCPR